jgi:8-oxo-dGTP pyrophosphatase MutT (NUDIX family)
MIQIGATYRHYKGNFYQVIAIATHSETGQEMVVYSAQYADEYPFGKLWARPAAMWNETINGVPRFQLVETIDKLAWMQIENGKQLVVRTRGKDKFYNPGGKREPGETDVQALVRELKEELNINIIPKSAKIFNTYMAQADGKPAGVMVKITAYTADYTGTPTPSGEIEEIAWIDSSDARRLSAIHTEKILPDLLKKGLIK